MYKYQNITEVEQNVMGIGLVEANGTIVTDKVIENPNFKYLGKEDAPEPTPEPTPEVVEPQPETQTQEQVEEIN